MATTEQASNPLRFPHQIKSNHLMYTRRRTYSIHNGIKNTAVSCLHSETKSIKANINNVQLCKINFAVTGQQFSRETSFKTNQ